MSISMPSSQSPRLLLCLLALTVYLVGATEFMLAPMLTPLAEAFRVMPARAAWLVSSYACAYASGAPVIGFYADRLDRWRLLRPALLLFAIDSVALTLAPSMTVAVVCRVLGGLASATLIPTTFALVSDIVAPARRAGAMGVVMFGMTLGIATGPACAGLLTSAFGWRAPFFAIAFGGLTVFAIAQTVSAPPSLSTSRTPSPSQSPRTSLASLLSRDVTTLLLTKAVWLGLAVSGFLLSGEQLRTRYALDTAQVGAAVAVFGLGLGAGNLITGRIDRCISRSRRRSQGRGHRSERTLLYAVALMLAALITFYLAPVFTSLPLPLAAAIACLAAWGFALGIAAPVSTALLATHAGADTSLTLSLSESLNNLVLLTLLPIGARLLAA